jgi:hypothetical protein
MTRRTNVVLLRLDEVEVEMLETLAGALGVTRPQWIRRSIREAHSKLVAKPKRKARAAKRTRVGHSLRPAP